MPTDDEIRVALRELGHEPPVRGKLSAKWKAIAAEGTPAAAGDGDWDAGDGAEDLLSAESDTPLEPETPPRTARSARRERRARPLGERLRGRQKASGTDKPKGKPRKRVPVDHLVGRAWEAVARFAAPLSLPMSRCLQVQSPVAGMILEEIVAGTMADRMLQPVARAEEKAEKVLALVAPPILVLALEQSAMLPPEQAMMRQALLVPMLRESLRIWLQVAGPKVEEAARREAEYQEKFGHTIDELIALFMNGTVPGEAVPVPEPQMAGASA